MTVAGSHRRSSVNGSSRWWPCAREGWTSYWSRRARLRRGCAGSVSHGVPEALYELQSVAAVGQMGLVQAYESCFQRHATHTAQILLTHEDFSDRGRYLNARSTLRRLLRYGVVPVVNENDAGRHAGDPARGQRQPRGPGREPGGGGAAGVADRSAGSARPRPPDRPGGRPDRAWPGRRPDPGGDGGGRWSAGPGRHEDEAQGRCARGPLGDSDTHRFRPGSPGCWAGCSGAKPSGRCWSRGKRRWARASSGSPDSSACGGACASTRAPRRCSSNRAAVFSRWGCARWKGDFARGEVVACFDPAGAEVARGLVNYDAGETRPHHGATQ